MDATGRTPSKRPGAPDGPTAAPTSGAVPWAGPATRRPTRDHSSHGDLSQGRPGPAIDLFRDPVGEGGGAGGLGRLGRLPAAALHRPVQEGPPRSDGDHR